VSKLYPPVSYPVSRGTPMIGSLVKWDHSVKWDVPIYKEKEVTSEYFEIDLSTQADAYIAGHKINGYIIFPGPCYIIMAWKTFAKMHGANFEDFPVVFKDIYFKRITIMPEEGTVRFLLNISKKNGKFEFFEGDTLVANGKIRVLNISDETDQSMLSSLTLSSDNKNNLPLIAKDIYLELGLRGYEYKGIFKGLQSCDNYGTIGKICWFNEWSVYLDTMFQLDLLSNSRQLVYGSRLLHLSINPIRHKQLISEIPKNDGLPIYYYKNLDLLKSGGIEVRGIKLTGAQRLQVQPNLKYERYVFVPYENPNNLSENPVQEVLHALTILLHIVQENIRSFKIKAVEVAAGRAAETIMAPLVFDILYSEPLVTVSILQYFSSNRLYSCNFRN